MKTQEIANKLVAYCRAGNFEAAQRDLFAADATSTEPTDTPTSPKVTTGLPAIIEKGKKFAATIEKVHSTTVSDPLVTDNVIALTMVLDVKMKGRPREKLSELCVYQVKDSKIVSEHFHM